ncbi:HutD/Ves family protein [Brytella acorum]|uniref:HutD/Ves family protein n=1 Tax=Brytella acorum TaxID=2959299 RepID=UPI0025AE1544|nr:HutD family protein [Brytella acorum]MDF3625340.1 HutD family protein [Brytella acorum]
MTIAVSLVASFPSRPWRNGRGMTREIAAGEGWRVSLADIDADGEFSTFPGLKRSLALASAGRLTLTGLSPAAVTLEARGDIVRFDGSETVSACCHGQSLRAFNLMARAGIRAGLALHDRAFALPAGARFVLLPLAGVWSVEGASRSVSPDWIAMGGGDGRSLFLRPDGHASACLAACVFQTT